MFLVAVAFLSTMFCLLNFTLNFFNQGNKGLEMPFKPPLSPPQPPSAPLSPPPPQRAISFQNVHQLK